MGNF
jgi:hypothetical protein